MPPAGDPAAMLAYLTAVATRDALESKFDYFMPSPSKIRFDQLETKMSADTINQLNGSNTNGLAQEPPAPPSNGMMTGAPTPMPLPAPVQQPDQFDPNQQQGKLDDLSGYINFNDKGQAGGYMQGLNSDGSVGWNFNPYGFDDYSEQLQSYHRMNPNTDLSKYQNYMGQNVDLTVPEWQTPQYNPGQDDNIQISFGAHAMPLPTPAGGMMNLAMS
jgi:hypothetical protein